MNTRPDVSLRIRPSTIVAGLLAALLASACAAQPPPPLGVGITTSASVTAGLVEHHRYHHHGGIPLLVAMSLDTLAVSAEQQPAVERIRTSLRTAMATARASDREMLLKLADGVASTHFDPATLNPFFAKVGDDNAKVYAASADALNELHGVLTPAQRKALFEKVAWHWVIWQDADGVRGHDNDWVATIVDNLGLTGQQADQAHAGFETLRHDVTPFDLRELTASIDALAEAFQKNDFDARSIPTAGPADGKMAIWGAEHLAYLALGAAPVLSMEQRDVLVKTIRDHARNNATPRAW